MTAVIPVSAAISTQSEKGKRHPEAITAPSAQIRTFCFFDSLFNASTRDVCPTPLAISCFPLTKRLHLIWNVLQFYLQKHVPQFHHLWVLFGYQLLVLQLIRYVNPCPAPILHSELNGIVFRELYFLQNQYNPVFLCVNISVHPDRSRGAMITSGIIY